MFVIIFKDQNGKKNQFKKQNLQISLDKQLINIFLDFLFY
jgi:hypothetical protein